MKVNRRQFVRTMLALGGLSATGLLAGCAQQPAVQPTLAQPTAPAAAPAATQPAAAPAQPARGGTLTVGLANDFNTFDPMVLSLVNYPAIPNFYDSLIRYDNTMNPLPALAERWEQSADGRSVTLTIRQGVKFHSGKDLTAEDVVKNFNKARSSETGFNIYQQVASVSEVSSPDNRTVVVQFPNPAPDVLDTLQILYIIDPDEMGALRNKAAGTGPFKFVEWVPGSQATAERNPNYWEQGKPSIDRVVYRIYADADAMTAALQSGIIDVATWVPYKDAGRLRDQFDMVIGQEGALTWEIRINSNHAPFDKKEMRQMMQYAINRQGIVDKVLFGIPKPTALPFPEYSPAYDPKWDQQIKFDLDKAKQLVNDAGYGGGFEAEMKVRSGDPAALGVAQVIQEDLSKIGGKVTITPMDGAAYTQDILGGNFTFTPSGSGRQHKYPTGIATNTIYRVRNNPVLKDKVPPAWIEAVDAANKTVDPAEQQAAFRRMAEVIMDESWCVTVCWRPSVFFTAKHVKGFAYNPDDMLFFHDVTVEK